jgi:tetratricopeptide (TPR) repeat protein
VWQHVIAAAEKIPTPQETAVTSTALSTYKKGLDKVNSYRGHPANLFQALQLFQETGCEPLFYGGVAYALFAASYKQNVTYERAGLATAHTWLARAQAIAPDISEINFIGVFLLLYSGRSAEAHSLIQSLTAAEPYGYYVRTALLDYYTIKQDEAKLTKTYQQTLTLAKTIDRRAYLHNRLGRYYMLLNAFPKSLAAYRELAQITPNDPWMWHNMSIIFLTRRNYLQALRCNKIALQIMDFGNARHVRQVIYGRIGGVIVLAAWLLIIAYFIIDKIA